MDLISLDTETTGLDAEHGCRVFFVTITDADGTLFWEWDVDPMTRKPKVPLKDKHEIQRRIAAADIIALQNAKFDAKMLFMSAILQEKDWPWEKVRDTHLAGHLLNSDQPHDLTTMASVYLKLNIHDFEVKMKRAIKDAVRTVKELYPDWKIAKEGLPGLPSAKGTSVIANDMWLPRALATADNYPEDHEFWTVLQDYGNADSQVTRLLCIEQEKRIKYQKLEAIYAARLKLLPIVCRMERTGLSLNRVKLQDLKMLYTQASQEAEKICLDIAAQHDYPLELPKGASNKSLTNFVFGYDVVSDEGKFIRRVPCLNLPSVKTSKKTGANSLDKTVLEEYEATLEPGPSLEFVKALRGKRKRDTAISYMESYQKFWINERPGWYRLFPSLNPVGTNTLRWSSANPNEQNISKQEGFNLRFMFGPAPGREWWSLDAKNIELRIPAYEAGESEMIDLFENPDKPPYFGSNHMLIFDTLHPEKFAEHGINVKKVYASTWYQWTKNGNFAVQYGAQNMADGSGTADKAYHVKGAQTIIEKRFTKIKRLNEQMIEHANKYGYVRTIPDKTIDPKKGYPLVCTQNKWGKIRPTVPLNYHVQGTAMHWMCKAMLRCSEYLEELNEEFKYDIRLITTQGYYLAAQVHDELVFDFPRGTGPKPWLTNLPKIRRIKRLMEEGGNDLGFPTPVSCEYHSEDWSEGISV
jgi:DNA polymerase I-like protein with 3'-5' exonuclease and polymerase domains